MLTTVYNALNNALRPVDPQVTAPHCLPWRRAAAVGDLVSLQRYGQARRGRVEIVHPEGLGIKLVREAGGMEPGVVWVDRWEAQRRPLALVHPADGFLSVW
jgi:hypothetical protein